VVTLETAANDTPRLIPFVVITGGSEGLGLAFAHRWAAAGHNVMIIARTDSTLRSVADGLSRQYSSSVVPLALDVTAENAPAIIDAALCDAGGYCDVLINNAGLGLSGPFVEASPASLDQLLHLNILALTRLSRHFLPPMLVRGHGGLLNVASLAAYTPGPYQAAYYASKAYVLSLTEALAHEAAGHGVTISALVPGAVATKFHTRMGATSALYTHLLAMPSPETIARLTYRRFRLGQRVIAPGVFATLSAISARFVPHGILVPLVGVILRPRT
jgi:uncharacterized protein